MSSLGIFIPKGLCRIAQGCREAATLGEKTLQCLTPKGFRIDNAALRNPFRVEQIIAVTTLGYLENVVTRYQITTPKPDCL